MNTTNKLNSICWTYFRIDEKGLIFSTDASIAFVILLFSAMVFVFAFSNNANSTIRNIENFELEEKALFLADSIVKNYDENNTALGACIYDEDKKRVLTNELSLENLKSAKPISFGKYFLQKIFFEKGNQKETIFSDGKNATQCISVKRFILLDNEKAIIFLTTCEG